MPELNVHRFGPLDGTPVLALHGLTGHGQRWRHLADGHLPRARMLEVADLTVRYPDYTDAAEARSEKAHGAWADVADDVLDEEMAEHLVELANGRVGWRYAVPAVVASWGELARPFVLPPAGVPTVLVQAMRVQPPYVTPAFRAALTERLGDDLTVVEMDVDHMVANARPAEVAALIDKLL